MKTETHHCIAIGDGAVADKPYELCIKTKNFEMREVMTHDEYLVLSVLLRRMIANNTLGPQGIINPVGSKP